MSYNVELELEDWHQQILGHRKAYKFICMWMAKTMQNLACKQCGIVINTLINGKAVQSCLHWGNKLWSCRLDAKAALLCLDVAGARTEPYLWGLICTATMSSNLGIERASWAARAAALLHSQDGEWRFKLLAGKGLRGVAWGRGTCREAWPGSCQLAGNCHTPVLTGSGKGPG